MRSSVYILTLLATTLSCPLLGLLPLNLPPMMAAAPAQSANETRQVEANQLFQQGQQQFEGRQFTAALQSFQTALKLYQRIGTRIDEAYTLLMLGTVYTSLGQDQQALEYCQQALSIFKDRSVWATSPQLSRQLESRTLALIGSIYKRQKQYSQALETLQQALALVKEDGNRKFEGDILVAVGLVYRESGEYPKALEALQQALLIRQQTSDRSGESIALNNIGQVYQFQGQYVQALKFYQQALSISRKIADRVGENFALNNIGLTYLSQGQYTQALEILQQSLKIYTQAGDRRGEGASRNSIGMIYFSMGQYAQALESFEQALEIEKAIDNRQEEATILGNIGVVYDTLGQPDRALKNYQQSLSVARESGNLAGEMTALNNIGRAYSTQNQNTQALGALQQSLSLARKIGNRAAEAKILNGIGAIYLSQKQDVQAFQSYQQALVIVKEIGDQSSEANILNGIGTVYQFQRRYTQALKFYQQAIGITRRIGERSGEARLFSNIGDLLFEQRQPELAIVFYKQSVNTWEVIRGGLRKLSIEQQQSFTNSVADSYRRLADLLLQQNRVLEAQRVLDLLKVQELEDYLRDVRGNAQTAQGVEYWQPEQRILELYNRAIAQGNELAQLRAIPDAKLTPKQRQRLEQLVTAEGEILQSFDAFTNRPEVAAAVQQLSQTSKNQNVELTQLNSLQNNLQQMKQDAVLLYPLILEDRLELVLVTPNSPPIRRPVNVRREDLNRAITEFLQALKDPTSDATKPGQKLYQWLIQPIEADLKAAKAQTIVYAPDGQLRYVPLAALYDGTQWLTQRFRVNYITAASLTDFDDPPQAQMKVLAAAFSDASRQFTVKAGDRSLTFAGLPYAKTEVENLAATIPGTTELLNAAFNRKSTLPRLGSYTLVHLATHAAFLPGQPEESFVLFGDGDRLSLRDLRQLNLPNVDLVVLSACETGVGNQLGNGIEILGFGFQMQRTGARASIASLWQVNDGGTQALMNDFYVMLQRGKISKAEALRQAQIAMITQTHPAIGKGQKSSLSPGMSDRLTHPYYWAPFILIGNGL